jgi:hypothetical protein
MMFPSPTPRTMPFSNKALKNISTKALEKKLFETTYMLLIKYCKRCRVHLCRILHTNIKMSATVEFTVNPVDNQSSVLFFVSFFKSLL